MLQGALRARDFTPSADVRMTEMSARLPKSPAVRVVEPSMGGAAAFLEFVENEIKPFVNGRHGVSDKRTTLFGSSMGGLFVAHTALTAPRSFDDFIAVSPALWWNQEEIFGVEQSRPDAVRNVFIAAGGLEEDPAVPGLADFRMVTNARRLATSMENAGAALRVRFEEIPGETHTSVVPAALTRGLRWALRQVAPSQ
jgi:hypothetical protein